MALLPLDWIAIVVWIGVVVISFGISLALFLKRLKFTEKTKIQLAFCFFFLCLGIGRAILVYADYFITELIVVEYFNNQLIWKIANFFVIVGLAFLILVSEYAVFKGKDYYVFTIGYAIVIIIAIFFIQDFYTVQNFTSAAVGFAAFIPISYIYLAIKFPMVRRNVILLLGGFLIFGAGLLLISAGLVNLLGGDVHLIYLLSAIVQIPGILIMAIAIKWLYFSEEK
jgi:hypothetical protein